MTSPLLDPSALELLRTALCGYTPDSVHALLGPIGRAAHERGDLCGVDRALPDDDRVATLTRMFLLGLPVSETRARDALSPLDLPAAAALLDRDGDQVRAHLEVRPYGTAEGGSEWWVLSDFGSDVRPGPLADDHVLGIGSASMTLAQAVPRRPAATALDLGTGCGIQALHLGTHATSVVATDVSDRALRLAATTAALSGQVWDLRRGSLLDPVADDLFDVIVANPPFVVSPGLRRGEGGYDYRDSGLAGDAVCEALLSGVPSRLAPGGTASLLANWVVPSDGDWSGRVGGWLEGRGCDAWVWQREVVDPGAYVTMWLRDAGEVPGTARWVERYTRWLDWFDRAGVAAVGMGMVTMWRTDEALGTVACEDVPQAVQQPVGTHVDDWVARQRWLRGADDQHLLAARLVCADGVVRTRHDLRGDDGGWQTRLSTLRQSYAMCWELEVDEPIARVVGACDGSVPLGVPLEMLAALTGRPTDEVVDAVLPVVRDLVTRGFLVPPPSTPAEAAR